jgi:ParB/RepB/Spo0J family partition protein
MKKTQPTPPTDAPAPLTHSPSAPPPVLARVPVGECVIAPGINREDLAITNEFQADIFLRGVISPLVVRERAIDDPDAMDARYEIWAGARRWTAAVKAFVPDVPVSIYPADTPTRTMAELRLIENLQREDLSPLDEARQYQEALLDYEPGRAGVVTLGVCVGKSASHIYSRLRLLKLPKALHQAWAKGKVPQSIVELIATLPDEKDQLEALDKISTGDSVYDLDTGKRTLECMSVRQARGYLAREFQSDLRKAIWALDDAALYPEAGPCTTCPFRGGHPEGAPGVDDPNACTRRPCYQKKRELSLKRKIEEAEAAGKTVVPAKEAEEIFRHSLVCGGDYVEAKGKPWQDRKGRTYEELLKSGKRESGKAGEASLVVHAVEPESGKLVKLYKKSGLNDALVAAGHDWAKPAKPANGNGSRPKPETAEAKAKREAEEDLADRVRDRVIAAVMKVVENPKITNRQHANLWAFMFSRWMHEVDDPTEAFYTRRKIARSSLHSIRELSVKSDLVLENVRGECLENALAVYGVYSSEAIEQLAGLCGVDMKAIEKQTRAELIAPKSPTKPKPAKPTAAPKKPVKKPPKPRQSKIQNPKSKIAK